MKFKLIAPINEEYSPIETILTNRGILHENIQHYLNTTDEDIENPVSFGEDILKAGIKAIAETITNKEKALIIVDADCDGYTSAAILYNYLSDAFPSWADAYLEYFLHDSKQHGLSDCIDLAIKNKYSLVFCPDSSSNDYEYHKMLKDNNIKCLVLDHHLAEKVSENAIIINNQLSAYSNKELSGAGVTWQFCNYFDSILGVDYAKNYIDLAALGADADMMSLRSIETKHLINKGFLEDNIKNPFFYNMVKKNRFSLGDTLTPIGVAFYVVPMINAIVRSGTMEEKELIFKSMLNNQAFKQILSTKRGHKAGEMETIVEQAIRVCTNVKNRQTKIQDSSMALLEKMIEEQQLLKHKVLLFLMQPGQIDKNVAGLCANKIMAKYQRPCCILTRVEEYPDTENIPPWEEVSGEPIISYQGSARGCDKVGVTEFKSICEKTEVIMYAEGHEGAFGLGILEDDIPQFIIDTDIFLKDMSDEAIYYVDYIYDNNNINAADILSIASLNPLYGKDIDESLIAIENLIITSDMITLMSPDKKPTLKISLPNKISIIKFNSNEEEYENLLSAGYTSINLVGKCNENNWNGYSYPQILLVDYEINRKAAYNF